MSPLAGYLVAPYPTRATKNAFESTDDTLYDEWSNDRPAQESRLISTSVATWLQPIDNVQKLL